MNGNHLDGFTIAIDRIAHQWAAKFAAGQTSIAKGRQVYLNTLAVCAVRQYLSCVCQLELDLRHGESWQVELQSIMNVADLVIPNVGKLECVPVLPDTDKIELAPEVSDGRIGYILVKFDRDLHSAELLGFVDRPIDNTIDLTSDRLQSLDELIDLIYTERVNHLQEFLVGILTTGWEPIESLIVAPARQFAIRNTLDLPSNSSYDSVRNFTASKTIDLRATIGNVPLLMLLGLNEEPDGRVKVRIRLHAAGGGTLLPPHLKLTLQGEHGDILSQIQYAEAMNFIQLQPFKLPPGTHFKIRVELDNSSFTESFVA